MTFRNIKKGLDTLNVINNNKILKIEKEEREHRERTNSVLQFFDRKIQFFNENIKKGILLVKTKEDLKNIREIEEEITQVKYEIEFYKILLSRIKDKQDLNLVNKEYYQDYLILFDEGNEMREEINSEISVINKENEEEDPNVEYVSFLHEGLEEKKHNLECQELEVEEAIQDVKTISKLFSSHENETGVKKYCGDLLEKLTGKEDRLKEKIEKEKFLKKLDSIKVVKKNLKKYLVIESVETIAIEFDEYDYVMVEMEISNSFSVIKFKYFDSDIELNFNIDVPFEFVNYKKHVGYEGAKRFIEHKNKMFECLERMEKEIATGEIKSETLKIIDELSVF